MGVWKLSAGLCAGLFLLLVVWMMPCCADQTVLVVWPMEEGQSLPDARGSARSAGFVQGVVQEADALLPAPMSPERKTLFAARIADRTRDLVLSYKELQVAEQAEPHALTMELNLRVNTPVLKKILKDLGMFYTSRTPVACSLTLTGLRSEDWQLLEDLQTLTGVKVIMGGGQEPAVPRMQLRKLAEDRWQGSLTAPGGSFSGESRTLDGVWSDLWQQYFALPGVIAGVFSSVTFEVTGWYVTDGPEYFEDILQSWDKVVEQADLVSLKMTSENLGGVWSVQTLDPPSLRTRLEGFLAGRGLHLVFFRQEEGQGPEGV